MAVNQVKYAMVQSTIHMEQVTLTVTIKLQQVKVSEFYSRENNNNINNNKKIISIN